MSKSGHPGPPPPSSLSVRSLIDALPPPSTTRPLDLETQEPSTRALLAQAGIFSSSASSLAIESILTLLPFPRPNSSRPPAAAILGADAILLCSGAGMGVDSGFGTFRGRHAGVWPPLQALGVDYVDVCSPALLASDPCLAWAFWSFSYNACDSLRSPPRSAGSSPVT
jgi:hypothetical protein